MQQSGALFRTLTQHINQGMTGAVLDVQHPVVAVGSFQSGGKTAVMVAIKLHAQCLEPCDALRRLCDEQSH